MVTRLNHGAVPRRPDDRCVTDTNEDL